jgi:hypothetical protein
MKNILLTILLFANAWGYAQNKDTNKIENEPYFIAMTHFVKWQKTAGSTGVEKRSKNRLNCNLLYDVNMSILTPLENYYKIDSFEVRFFKDPLHVYDEIKQFIVFQSPEDSLFDVYFINNPVAIRNNMLIYTMGYNTYMVKSGYPTLYRTEPRWVFVTLLYDCDKKKYTLESLRVSDM